MEENKEGRPPLTREELQTIVRKLEPFLKSGQSLKRACLNAQVSHTTAYKYYKEDEWFADQIDAFSSYPTNLVGNLFFGRLVGITAKYNKLQDAEADFEKGTIDEKEYKQIREDNFITRDEWSFVWQYATRSKATRDEYGMRAELTGKDGEPLVPETSTREVAELLHKILHTDDGTEPVELIGDDLDETNEAENTNDTDASQ